jgi:uncharacterized membrane protein
MKLVVCLILAVVPAVAQTPVGYWPFSDGTGSRAIDASGTGNTAALVNGMSWVPAQAGGGVSANAAWGQYVSIPAVNLSSTHAVTVVLWSKRTYSTSGGHVLFEATTNFTQSTTGFGLFPDDATCMGVQAALKGDVGETANCYNQPSSGVWHHLVIVYDKTQTSGNQVALFVDGVLQNPTRSLYASTNTNSFGNDPIYLFSRGGTQMFDTGRVRDLRIYASALTAAQIQQIYHRAAMAGISGPAKISGATARAAAQPPLEPGFSAAPSLESTGITLDVHAVHDNGSSANSTSAVSIGTPTVNDLITCEVTFDGHNANALVSVSDNQNGSYIAAVPAHLNTTLVQWFGTYYRQAVAGSPTTVTLKTSQSNQWAAISCQAWKGAATSNSLDSGFVQSRDALSTANPTTGANKTPSGNGELIIGGLGLYSSGTPTAGANYHLIDSASASQWWPEYWIQTTAAPTAGNYVRSSDNFTDMMAAFRPAAVASTFSIVASPTSLTVAQGNQGTSTITTTVSGSFNNPITLSAAGAPAGATVSFGPNPIAAPGAGTASMTITVGSSTAVGAYPITVTGTGGGIQQSTIVTLKVTTQGSFTIAASPTSLALVQGHQGTSTITTTVSGGFSNPITLSVSGVPTGTTASFSANPIPAPGAGSSTLTLAASSSTAVGTYSITVTGTGGGIQQSTIVTLKVTTSGSFTIAASPTSLAVVQGNQGASTITTTVSGGFSNPITLSAAGAPAGTTVTFGPNPIAAPGAGTASMTITVGSSTAVGTYPITITGAGGGIQQTSAVNLTVTAAPNFTISSSPTTVSVVQGNQGASTITTTVSGGFSNPITLSSTGAPAGTTVSFGPNPIAAPGAGTASVTITVGSSTAVGTYLITITGAGGGIQHTSTVNLTVNAAPNFTISSSPTTVSVVQGNQGASTITTTVSGGFSNAITLAASGVPAGTTVTFSPNPIAAPGAGTASMTITVGGSTAVGTYPITITGNGGGIQHTSTVNLTVTTNVPPQVALSWTASTSTGIAGYNAYRSATSGGPYTKLNSSVISSTAYTDLSVVSGSTYYYVTTAIDSQSNESAYSNQAAATVP